ncbi:MAG: M14 family metallopeptidase [Candidatus Zhuqueibacterota bacterium]
MKRTHILVLIMACATMLVACRSERTNPDQDWQTYYEKSGNLETPRFAETQEFFQRLDAASQFAQLTSFGLSPEGRVLLLFIISSDMNFTPEKAARSGRPIVLIQCCIHPGESEGKDAAMMLARDMLIHNRYPEIFERMDILIIPIFNVDGHEAFGPYNRINQNGPTEMGWRVTATRLNLNRDFVKADAPEMRAWLALYRAWQPHLFYDCHTTDGLDFQYVLTYKIDTHPDFGGAVSAWARDEFLPAVLPAFEARGHLVGPFAGLIDQLHPEKGLMGGVWRPMLSNPYATVRNRAGMLIETHSLKPYPARVAATYDFILVGLMEIAKHPEKLLQAVKNEDERAASLGALFDPGKSFALNYITRTDVGDTFLFRGYEIEVKKGLVSNADYLSYRQQPRNVTSVLFETVTPGVTIVPALGYLIPQQWTEVIDVLKCHGVKISRLTQPVTEEFEGYRFTDVKFRTEPYEGRQLVSYKTHGEKSTRTFPAGTYYVPLGCPESKIIMHMLEPQAPDALVGWGFFNTIFEQREYVEDYMMEPLAQEMLNNNPEIRREFEQRLHADKNFAENPRARLHFFYERSPYWDREKDLYPVVRVIHALDENAIARQPG